MSKRNPFNPNSVVIPSLFAGRTKQVLQILNKLNNVKQGMSASFVLCGDRGIGKTALAKLVKYIASLNAPEHDNLNFLTSYYTVQEGQSFEYVLETSLNYLTDQLPESALKRLSERLGSIFKSGKFSFGAFSLDIELSAESSQKKKEKVVHLKDQAISIFTNILKGIQESKDPTKHDGILIVIDEVHNLADLPGVALLLRNIATTLDVENLGNISFLIIGYPEAVEDFFEGDPSAKRHFDQIFLDCMPLDEAKEIWRKGFDGANVKFEEKDLDKYIRYTGGYPHSVQLFGHNLIEVDTDSVLDSDDWGRALHRTAVELQTKDFSLMYDFNGKETLKETILNVLAISSRPLTKVELKDFLSDKNVYRGIQDLRKLGAIKEDSENGTLELSSILFKTAIFLHIIEKIKTSYYLKDAFDKFYEVMPESQEQLELTSKDK